MAILLIFGVTGLEAPEFLSLSDDICDEPAMARYLEEVASRPISGRATPQGRKGCTKIEPFNAEQPHNLASIILPPLKAGRDLLRLLALQRI
jgi:hypothetical protein